jgi:two-component system, LytTR family, response regulator
MLSAVVIEEDAQHAQHLAALLEDTWQVDVLRTATDSCAGLSLCGELRPDVVFLDIDVPRRNGGTLGELTQIAQPPRLVFTARDADRAVDAFRFDAFDFLQKPLDPMRVAETGRPIGGLFASSPVRPCSGPCYAGPPRNRNQ